MNRCIKTNPSVRKARRFMFGCAALTVLLGVIAVGNMTYDDEVGYEEHRQAMEQLWEDSEGQYGWPRQRHEP
jgi:hypothetical protein